MDIVGITGRGQGVFAWDLGVIFVGIPNFKIFGFQKKKKKNRISRFYRKMCELFPFIPIFKGFFLLKSKKKMCICDYVKNRIVTFKIYGFLGRKGIMETKGELVSQVAPKHTAHLLYKNHFIVIFTFFT